MKKVIYTVIVNGYDELLDQPQYDGWDYVCFTDGKRLPLKSRLGFGQWQIRKLPDLGFDKFRASRIPKILPHKYLPDYDYSVYIDGNAYLVEDPSIILEEKGWPIFANSYHPHHSDLQSEFAACIKVGKSDPNLLRTQQRAYQAENVPDDLQVMENNLLMRNHNAEEIIALSKYWWQEMNHLSHRDQLSLPYICWKSNFAPLLITQKEKHRFFRTKSHYRSYLFRMINSLQKRYRHP